MNIYFTSDTHFGSERTLKFSGRPFDTTKEMDRHIINEWNKTVKREDLVWHLGDFGNLNIAKYLNGKIILIKGNYEENIPDEKLKEIFHDVSSLARYCYNNGELKYVCAHKPSDCKAVLMKKRQEQPDVFGLFGHIHGLQKVKKWGYNVGTDPNHYRLVSMDQLEMRINAIKNHYDEEVWMS